MKRITEIDNRMIIIKCVNKNNKIYTFIGEQYPGVDTFIPLIEEPIKNLFFYYPIQQEQAGEFNEKNIAIVLKELKKSNSSKTRMHDKFSNATLKRIADFVAGTFISFMAYTISNSNFWNNETKETI